MADLDGKIVEQLTASSGYDAEATLSPDSKKMIDGGAWFSPDGSKIIWRASRPRTEAAVKEYTDLLSENLVAQPVWKSG